MKKTAPYIILALVAVALIAMFMTGAGRKKKMDERITLRKKDKIPYGTWVAFESLPEFFPGASIYTSRREPGYWDSVSLYDSKQLFIAITPKFEPDDFELKKLISFAENGNDVFISAKSVSWDVEKLLNCSVRDNDGILLLNDDQKLLTYRDDSLELHLLKPPFKAAKYFYPGRTYDGKFTTIDRKTTDELGVTDKGDINFIHLKAGKGNFYLHLTPLAFSNYFLLHKNNMEYYEKVMSVMDPEVQKIVWDEYYLNKRNNEPPRKKKNWITVLFRYPALKAALLTAIFTLLAYLLLEMRRKQRQIPVMKKPKNDSLDFVKTIGRLYYDRSDHKNLCLKMSAYFLEHIRSRYKLATGTLDDTFVKNLQFKTGADETEIRKIITFIRYVQDAPEVRQDEVADFHKQLESFYNKA